MNMNFTPDYLIPEATKFGMICLILWILVIVAVLLDLWDGLNTAKKLHKKIKSHRMRITIDKISEYWRFLLIAALVDCVGLLFTFYQIPYISILFTIGLIGVEGKSLFEHAKERKSKVIDLAKLSKIIIDAKTNKDVSVVIKEVADYLGVDVDDKDKDDKKAA